MSANLKILRIVGFKEPGGGGQKHILMLSQGLRVRGHRDILLCPRGALAEDYKQRGCEVIPLNQGMEGLASWQEIAGIIKKEKPEIVHTHMPWADGVGGMAAKGRGGLGLVTTIHGFYYTNSRGELRDPFQRWLYGRWLTWAPQKIITISDALKNWLVKEFKVPAGKIVTLHDGVEIKQLPLGYNPAQKRQELGIGEGEMLVAVVGRLEPAKGQATVIEALPRIAEKYPAVKVLFLGEGSERTDLERKAQEYRVADKVKFLGYRQDLAEILGACQAFILPSIKEGLSIALLEALYWGLPVIASRVGGIPEVVEDGVTGLLFAAKDSSALTEAWLKIFDQPSWAQAMGKKGHEKVRQNFSIDSMVAGVEGIYKELEKR